MRLEGLDRRHDMLRRGTRPLRELKASNCHVLSQIQQAMLAVIFFGKCHADVMAGHFVFRIPTVGARQGSSGQNAENSRGGIFGI
jgi:hypothetical protein